MPFRDWRRVPILVPVDDLLQLTVPAFAAIVGVVITQTWVARHDRARWAHELQQRMLDDRRAAFVRAIVAVNQAIDATRRAIADHVDVSLKHDCDLKWALAYERYLELRILLPEQAQRVALNHVTSIEEWYRRAFEEGTIGEPPVNEALIDSLSEWLNPVR